MGFDDSGKKPVTVGPWGGSGGSRWDDGMYSTVRQLLIVHGAGIDSIKIEYDQKGCSIWSDKHGGSGGYKTDTVKLDYPDEYLTSVHGHYGSLFWLGPTFVRSLSFESNKKKYGPFGVETGTYFSFPITGGKIVGFHGRCGWYLDAIGVYLKPLQQQNPTNGLLHSQKNQGFDDSGKKPVTVGPWGGSGGSRWDDGMYSTVRQLLIVHGAGIDSIKIEYDQKGCSIWSDKHGGSGGYKTDTVKLDYPDEYLTSVHGHYGSLFWLGPTFVRSLSFESNKKKYGPFGVEAGTYFSFPITGGKIVGFFGRCGWYLDAIGVYLKTLQQQNPSNGLLHS